MTAHPRAWAKAWKNHRQGPPHACIFNKGHDEDLCVCSSCPRDGIRGHQVVFWLPVRHVMGTSRLLAVSVRSIVYRLQRRVRDGFSPSSVTCAETQWTTEREPPQGKCI